MSALAKIHIAKKELNLHDDDYRAILKRLTGQESAKGLSFAQADAVIDEFKRLGWKPKVVAGGKKAVKPESGRAVKPAEFDSARKARALWISLWQLGAIDDRSESALEAFAKRQLKCERLVWADQQQMYKLIEALKKIAERNGWKQSLTNVTPGHELRTLKFRLVQRQRTKLRELGLSKALNQRFLSAVSGEATIDELDHLAKLAGEMIRKALDHRAAMGERG